MEFYKCISIERSNINENWLLLKISLHTPDITSSLPSLLLHLHHVFLVWVQQLTNWMSTFSFTTGLIIRNGKCWLVCVLACGMPRPLVVQWYTLPGTGGLYFHTLYSQDVCASALGHVLYTASLYRLSGEIWYLTEVHSKPSCVYFWKANAFKVNPYYVVL